MKQSLFAQRMKQKKEIQKQEDTGFPQTFKVDLTPTPTRAQFHGLSEQEYKKIDEENLKAIKEMSEQQVLELQAQIKESLGDNLCKMFESGDIYQLKQQKQMQLEINQNISKNKEVFNKLIDEDHIVISQIQELTKSAELSSVKIALQKMEQVLKIKNVVQLESINISDYLISVGKSTNLSVSMSAFELLYTYWTSLIPDCWNSIYNCEEIKQIQEIYTDLPIMLNNLQHSIDYSKVLDLLRIRNILSQSNSKYIIEAKSILNVECKLKSIILLQEYQDLKQIDFSKVLYSEFVFKFIIRYNQYLTDEQFNIIISQISQLPSSNLRIAIFHQYQSRFNCKLINEEITQFLEKPRICEDLSIYEIVPFQSLLIDIYDQFNLATCSSKSIVPCLKVIISLIFDVRFQAKSIISKKQRKLHKWRALNIMRVTFQELFKVEANKRNYIKDNYEKYSLLDLIRQQLKIEFHLNNEQELHFETSLYTGLYQFLRQHEYDVQVVQNFIDKFQELDIDIRSEFMLLKLYKLLISDKQHPQGLNQLYSYLLDKINIHELSQLLNKNVSYFEKLLQKCQFDSYFQPIYVNTLFLFSSPLFNPDFHQLLFQEFLNSPILNNLDEDIYIKHLQLFTIKPLKGLEIYRANVLDLPLLNVFIQQWQTAVQLW